MIRFVAQRMLEIDAEGLCAAAYGERSPEPAIAGTATARGCERHGPARST